MSKAFVDTTILADALLKPGERAKSAKKSIASFSVSQLPVFAIKEFKAGPLRHFAWFHNKLVSVKSFWKVMEALQKESSTPRRYLTSTALEALTATARKFRSLTNADLVQKYGSRATVDQTLYDLFRLSIRTSVESAWRRRRKVTSEVVIPLSCYIEEGPRISHSLIDCKPDRCRIDGECCLAAQLKAHPDDLHKLKDANDKQSVTRETQCRSQALRQLIRVPKRSLSEKMCRDLGDALFAFFAPDDAIILTTNLRDHRPLADALGKKVQKPEP